MRIHPFLSLIALLWLPFVSRAQNDTTAAKQKNYADYQSASRTKRDTLFRRVSITYFGSGLSYANVDALNGQLRTAGYLTAARSGASYSFAQVTHYPSRIVSLFDVQYVSNYGTTRMDNVLASLQIGYELVRTPQFRLWPSVGLAYARTTIAASAVVPQTTTFGSYLANAGATPRAVLYNRIGAAPIGIQLDYTTKRGSWYSLRAEHYVPFGTNWKQQDNNARLTDSPSFNPVLVNVRLLLAGSGRSR